MTRTSEFAYALIHRFCQCDATIERYVQTLLTLVYNHLSLNTLENVNSFRFVLPFASLQNCYVPIKIGSVKVGGNQ
jgi:hypothetical protein